MRRGILALLAAATLLAGCGDDDDDGAERVPDPSDTLVVYGDEPPPLDTYGI